MGHLSLTGEAPDQPQGVPPIDAGVDGGTESNISGAALLSGDLLVMLGEMSSVDVRSQICESFLVSLPK